MIDLKEEIKLMDNDGDATLILALYQLEELNDHIEKITTLLNDVIEHCEYCGWGDSWEREYAEDLIKRVEDYQRD